MIALDAPRSQWTSAHKTLGLVLLCLSLFTMELLAGSSYAFASLTTVYLLVAVLAVRCQGGLSTVFGLIVFIYAAQHVLISQVLKIVLGERPDSRLFVPVPTICTEILLMLGFAAAGVVASKISPNRGRPFFPPIADLNALRRLAIGALGLALVRNVFAEREGPLHMLSIIDSVAVASSVGVAVVQSGGRKLTNGLVWAIIVPIVGLSLAMGGRGGLFQTFLMVGLAGWAFGYRYRFIHAVVTFVFVWVMFFILSPYSLASREVNRTPDFVTNVNRSLDVLAKVIVNPGKYQVMRPRDIKVLPRAVYRTFYFDLMPGNAQDVLNRLSLIKFNDLIVEDTLKSGTIGWANVTPGLHYLLPGFLTDTKDPRFATGNALAHRVQGLVNDNDHTTGITVGLTADTFSAFGWWGVLLLPAGLLFLNVVVFKFVVNLDLRRNVFGLAVVAATAPLYPELVIIHYVQVAVYYVLIYCLGLFLVTRAAALLDFRHLRPRTIPDFAPADEASPALAR